MHLSFVVVVDEGWSALLFFPGQGRDRPVGLENSGFPRPARVELSFRRCMWLPPK